MKRARNSAGDGPTAGRTDFERFEAFYAFAFPRVHRFALRRAKEMIGEIDAEALTERILVSALTSLGGTHVPFKGLHGDPAGFAFQLFAIAHRVADQVEEDPSLLDAYTECAEPDRDRQTVGRCRRSSTAPGRSDWEISWPGSGRVPSRRPG